MMLHLLLVWLWVLQTELPYVWKYMLLLITLTCIIKTHLNILPEAVSILKFCCKNLRLLWHFIFRVGIPGVLPAGLCVGGTFRDVSGFTRLIPGGMQRTVTQRSLTQRMHSYGHCHHGSSYVWQWGGAARSRGSKIRGADDVCSGAGGGGVEANGRLSA